MTKRKTRAEAVTSTNERRGYTEVDMAEVMDFPEMTDEERASAKPFAEVLPDLAKTIRQRGKQKAPTKVPISLRVDRDVLDAYKASGPGWQGRMGDALRKGSGL